MTPNRAIQLSSIDYLTTIDTPTLSNSIEMLGVRPRNEGFTPLQIRCLFPELGRMCGYAATAQVETVTSTGPEDPDLFMQLYETVAGLPKPVVVAFQEIGGSRDYAAHCGEVMATIFQRVGAVGLVTDCAVRDIPEVRALRFHYFARGAVASHACFRIVRVGVPIQILGLVIRQGDVLHGDENGLLLVPREAVDRLPEAINSIRCSERALMEFVRGPNFSLPELKGRILE